MGLTMIQRLYIHNFRCLVNFELYIGQKPSALLIGKNGAGKSTVRVALELLQSIARGTNRIGQLVKPMDFFLTRFDEPMRFEIDADLHGSRYQYRLALEYPSGFRELRVLAEELSCDGQRVYSRDHAQVSLHVRNSPGEARPAFRVDWHLVALPLIQEQSGADPLAVFKGWLARSLILAPMPAHITGDSSGETLEPDRELARLGEWFTGLISFAPAVYSRIEGYLREILPDLIDIKNPNTGLDSRSLRVQFRQGETIMSLPFASLSDGEKCFFVCALVLAASQAHGPVLCFWDEPDSHLAMDEVGHFITELRREVEATGGQILMTSHNPEAVRRFSDESTLLLYRRSHLEPTQVRTVDQLGVSGDLVGALIRGDVEP